MTAVLQIYFNCHKGDLAMKKSFVVLFGAALLSFGAVVVAAQPVSAATNVTSSVTEKFSQSDDFGVLTAPDYSQQLYTDAKLTKPANRTVPASSKWRYTAVLGVIRGNDPERTYSYRVATNLWLPAEGVRFLTSYQPGTSVWHHDIVQVNNNAGARVYSDLTFKKPTGRVLPKGSRWQFARGVTNRLDELIGYQVGTNEFVLQSDVSIVQRRSVFTAQKGGADIVNGPGTVQRKVAGGSRWRTTSVTFMHNRFYYQIATYLWVDSNLGTWTPQK